jgi:peptide/nickel transport system substrate-binding protein
MNRFFRILALVMCAAMMFTLLTACGGGDTSGEAAAEKDTFTIALDSDIVKLDPAFAYDFTTNPVVNQITQGLLVFDEENQLQPMLASSWEQVDDVTYVYQIRDDVTFSDGSAMTMDDVLYSMERIANPDTASYLGWMYDNVASIEQTGDWELTVRSVVVFGRIELVDDIDSIRAICAALSRKFTDDESYIEREIEAFAESTYLLRLRPENICGKWVKES